MLQFLESGGNYHASNVAGPGIWAASVNNNIVSNAPAGAADSFAYQSNSQQLRSVPFSTTFTGLVAGYRCYNPNPTGGTLIAFTLAGANICAIQLNGSQQIIVTRNNGATTIAGPSSASIVSNTWNYIEFKATFATTATATVNVQLNGVNVLSASGVQTVQSGTAACDAVAYFPGSSNGYARDFYCCDTTGVIPNDFQGDITVEEIFDNGAGVHSDWAVQQGSFTLTAVANASAGTTAYTGTITNGTTPTNAWQGYYFTVTGFTNGANNGTFLCTASTTTTITLANAAGVAETHAGTCAFQNPLQIGIHGGGVDLGTTNLGTRPPSDSTGPLQYLKDSTPGDKTDYAHQAISLSGTIPAICHRAYARKDDAGTRSFLLYCLSSGSEEDSTTFGLNTSLQYYSDYVAVDPNTGVAFTPGGFNGATFGVKEVS